MSVIMDWFNQWAQKYNEWRKAERQKYDEWRKRKMDEIQNETVEMMENVLKQVTRIAVIIIVGLIGVLALFQLLPVEVRRWR